MDYEKHYKALCHSRQQLRRAKLAKEHADYCYYELHHIVPVHENGSNEKQNLVLLTAREHFIAHWLFAKWKRTKQAYAGFAIMAADKHGNRLKLNSLEYSAIRQANSLAQLGRKDSAETTIKRKIAALNRPPKSKETCLKISASKKNKKDSLETRRKKSESRKGLKHSEETKLKQRNSGGKRKGQIASAESKIRYAYANFLKMQIKYGYCKLCSKEAFLALEAYLQYA